MSSAPSFAAPEVLSRRGRYVVLLAAFLGWMFSGVQMTMMNLASGSATQEFVTAGRVHPTAYLSAENLLFPGSRSTGSEVHSLKELNPRWFALYNSAFLFGAACGGLIFGWIGDRAGRVKAMGLSILCYSLVSGLAYFAAGPEQLLAMRFLAAMGVGGMWPSGVSLASEAWSEVSRPMLAGLIGTAANVGIVLLSVICYYQPVTPDSWRWVLLLGATPALLGMWVLTCVPESPQWLAARQAGPATAGNAVGLWDVFRPPLLRLTLIGIALGAIPLLGGWGVTAWVIRWTESVTGAADGRSKALTAIMRASGGAIGSLLGGWFANLCGRRTAYFLISLASFALGEYIFWQLSPLDPGFSTWVFIFGFVTTIYFGWLPLYLPELFPTHARATGSGVSFNFGRILTAAGVLGTGALVAWYGEDYGQAGRVTSLIYAVGMIIILFAPNTRPRDTEITSHQ